MTAEDNKYEPTIIVADYAEDATDIDFGSGVAEPVIDREEWDKILAEVDETQKEQERLAALEAQKSKKDKKKNSKKKKTKKAKKARRRKFWAWFFAIIITLGVLGCCAGAAIVYKIIQDTPEIDPSNLYDLLSENSVILDSDGGVMDYIYKSGTLRENIEYSDLPENLIWAFVDTEDKTFFTHHGFNFIRIMGAIWTTIKSGGSTRIGGTSTITQQLARNLYLTDTKSSRGIDGVIRKIKEAYYTVVLEKALSKEQILEAYLNTIFLGFNADGVSSAARVYFSKDVSDLTLIEAAIIAAQPQSPTKYAPIKRLANEDVNDTDYDIISRGTYYSIVYNSNVEDRVWVILHNMVTNGHLSQEEFDYYEANLHELCRNAINPDDTIDNTEKNTSYFADYVVDQVVEDLQSQLGYTEDEAYELLYTGGLIINSTMRKEAQDIVEESFNNRDLFTTCGNDHDGDVYWDEVKYDDYGNLLTPDSETDTIYIYEQSNMFRTEYVTNENGETEEVLYFDIQPSEYYWDWEGNLVLKKGERLNFYKTKSNGVTDITIEFKYFYEKVEWYYMYVSAGGNIFIDSEYKTKNDDGELVIDKSFFTDTDEDGNLLNEGIFIFNEDGTITVNPANCDIDDKILQPQGAFVIIENSTGQIAAMIGGREIVGSKLFNRATNTRQTGSSIKPLSIYSLFLQKGYTNALLNAQDGGDRETYNLATMIDDIPGVLTGELWPQNDTENYKGRSSTRYAVQFSRNTCAVSIYRNYLTANEIVNQLQSMGISSLVLSGEKNDVNAGALALGGQVNGISPLEECAAYATIGNYGVYNSPTCYTTVTTKSGDIILEAQTETHRVLDEEVASLCLNMLRSVVTDGYSKEADLTSQMTGGKTGTTTNYYDLWYSGITQKYTATFWNGSDYNIHVNASSAYHTTTLWKSIMEKVGALDPYEAFELRGDFVEIEIDTKTGMLPVKDNDDERLNTPEEDIETEIFIKGTEPTESSDARVIVEICTETGYLATPECKKKGCTEEVVRIQRVSGSSWESILASYSLESLLSEDEKEDEYGNVYVEVTEEITDEETGEKTEETKKVYKGTEEYEELLEKAKAKLYNLIQDCGDDVPDYYCPEHNTDTKKYPVSPFAELSVENWKKAQEEAKKAEEENEEGEETGDNTEEGNED